MRWQGGHHSAQKSTSTGRSLPSTSSAKVSSVTSTVVTFRERGARAGVRGTRGRGELLAHAGADRAQLGEAVVDVGELAGQHFEGGRALRARLVPRTQALHERAG